MYNHQSADLDSFLSFPDIFVVAFNLACRPPEPKALQGCRPQVPDSAGWGSEKVSASQDQSRMIVENYWDVEDHMD